MNKKITAVTLTALMVLTMFTAMVPTASAAKEVAAPYEFIGAVNDTNIIGYSNLSATSKNNPSILFYDIDDAEGNETFYMKVYDNTSIDKGELTYTTTQWTDDDGYDYISWTGSKYAVVQNGTGDWIISEKLVDEDDSDDHLLRVGESLALAEGFAITALEIDVDGGEAWISLTKDGEEIDNEVVTEKAPNFFVYKKDLGASAKTEVMNFTVETVFAGMNTNLVKISDIDLISMDTIKIESSDTDLYDDFKITTAAATISITNDDDISFGEDDTTEIMGDNFAIRVNEDSSLVALVKVITEPGTYELIGAVNDTYTIGYLSATSRNNPSILFYDINDAEGNETFNMTVHDNTSIDKGELTYTTTQWTDDDGYDYISWTGSKYAVVQNGTGDWIISEKLVDEDDSDDHLLRVGESLALAEGFAVTALEIDVDGGEAWISLTKDGEEIDNEVVTETAPNFFVYKKDLGASAKTEVMNFTVETVFAGMNTNLVKISDIDLISMDTIKIESSDTDLYDDFKITTAAATISITNDDDISFGEDDTTEIMGDNFAIRVNEDSSLVALVQTVIVGGGAAPTPTEDLTVEPTVEPTETATGAATAAPTAAATAAPIDETPTPEPTKEPGFEAVFAVAGLLAVAYLVLRQRE